jgi:CRP/FNR family transcriptional regulator, cyclic AMP receptor protein
VPPEANTEAATGATAGGGAYQGTHGGVKARRWAGDSFQLPAYTSADMTDADALARLADAALFAEVPRKDLSELAGRFVATTLERGSVVFRQGEEGDALYLVESGAVKISCLSPDGREVVLAVLGPGEVFGELSLFDRGVRTADATALEDTVALALSHEVFRPFLDEHPGVAVHLLGVLAGRLRETGEALQDVIFSDVPGRLAKRLLDLAARYGTEDGDGTAIDLTVTQEELAQMVGAARESVNKAVASFVARGWISMRGRRYVVTDEASLRRRAT